MITDYLAQIIIQKQRTETGVETVTFEHPAIPFQIKVSVGHDSFVIDSSQVLGFRRYSDLAWEVLPMERSTSEVHCRKDAHIFLFDNVASTDSFPNGSTCICGKYQYVNGEIQLTPGYKPDEVEK